MFFMKGKIDVAAMPVGVVGLGLMGCSITTCLLMAGHPVIAVAPVPADLAHAERRIGDHWRRSVEEGLIKGSADGWRKGLTITEDYGALRDCVIVIECTLENLAIKEAVYKKIEGVISPGAILTSNTSAFPISVLQERVGRPERF